MILKITVNAKTIDLPLNILIFEYFFFIIKSYSYFVKIKILFYTNVNTKTR